MGLARYHQVMVEAGYAPQTARDVADRLREHGCERIFWDGACGGRRGRVNASWDVRVATTDTPASESVPAITSMGPLAPGTDPLPLLVGHPGVLQAYSMPAQPFRQTIKPTWGIPRRLSINVQFAAYAAIAIGHVGATITVLSGNRPATESAIAYLTDLVLRDIETAASVLSVLVRRRRRVGPDPAAARSGLPSLSARH